jgi:hypothetical protein
LQYCPEDFEEAIEEARQRGISQYLEIMKLFPNTDVSTDKEFQRIFKGFYFVGPKPPQWYEQYFSYMQSQRGQNPTFSDALRHLYSALGRREYAFSSKLVATLNVNSPILDSKVLSFLGEKRPPPGPNAINQGEAIYIKLETRYETCMGCPQGGIILRTFREMVPEHGRISDVKKIDFVLWKSEIKRNCEHL